MVSTRVRPARADDIESIVALHTHAFPGFFLTTLGRRFLFELYRGFLQAPSGRLFVADVDGEIIGFAAGTLAPEQFFRNLVLARWFAFAWAALRAATRHPHAVIPRLVAALGYRGERPRRLSGAALLSSIAVDPRTTRAGIGSVLLTAYCEEVWKQHLQYVYLMTDRDVNEPANRFYLRHGFTVESEIRRRNGRIMVRYVRPRC